MASKTYRQLHQNTGVKKPYGKRKGVYLETEKAPHLPPSKETDGKIIFEPYIINNLTNYKNVLVEKKLISKYGADAVSRALKRRFKHNVIITYPDTLKNVALIELI